MDSDFQSCLYRGLRVRTLFLLQEKAADSFFPEPPFLPGCRWALISIRIFTGVTGERLWDTLLEN